MLTGFTGQISGRGVGMPGIVWHVVPYVIKVFLSAKARALSLFEVNCR